ncbi:TPA: autotransporter outer membrane beta-barrel domain-containing protein [Yersinia enterocolitica]|nr:autotransporter outer membrane beta-barrel domain-containing protein [Yersinia enterocolitica]
MENINNSRKHILKTPILKQVKFTLKKSPIAKFIASVLFILGSASINVNANTTNTHEGAVNNKDVTLRLDQKSKNAIINGSGSLILTDQAEAFNTEVNTDDISSLFLLRDESQANTTKIPNGKMEIIDDATASNTFIGLTEEENEQRLVDPKMTGRMDIYKSGTARYTTVGIYGELYLGGHGTAEETHIKKGGKLGIQGDLAYLSDTTIEGVLELDGDVVLSGYTKFLPGSELKTNNFDIKNNGEITFSGQGGGIVANIDGSGSLSIESPEKTLILKGQGQGSIGYSYSYSGLTHIKAGTLKLSEAEFSVSPIIGEVGSELVLSNSILETNVQGSRMTLDGGSIWRMAGDSRVDKLNILEDSHLILSSKLYDHHQIGNKLTINGNYHSDGGTLTFYSKLEGDDSETDSMLVEGNTSGLTNVKINNLGGEGAQTDLGILLIEVKGESKGEFKQVGRNPAGAFEYFLRRGSEGDRKNWYMISDIENVNKKPILEEKIEQAVLLEVGKNEGKANANKSNVNPHEVINTVGEGYPTNPIIQFLDKTNAVNPHEIVRTTTGKYSDKELHEFLTTTFPEILGIKEKEKVALANSAQTTAPTTEIENESENTLVNKSSEVTPTIQPKDVKVVATPNKPNIENNKNIPQKTYQPVYRPENGSYIANLSMARNLFISDLDNRSGNYKYKDAATGEWRTSSMWIQTQGGIKQFGKTIDQLNIKGKYYSIQLGGDVAKWDIGTQGSGRIGMLAGIGKATNHSKSNITGYYSNGSVNGYNLGVYATWLTDQQNKTGLYIDTLAQYSWFNNAVNGKELAEEKYKSSGFTSSIESGYTFNIGSTEQLSYFIQPNAKITWVGINAQTHTATNKDIINYTNRGQLITRIGAKTYLQTTNNSDQQFMPFIAVNWLHQNHNTGTQLSGKSVDNSSKNSAEFKIGVESKIDQRLHAWANINHQIGNYNTSDTNVLVGIKYAF